MNGWYYFLDLSIIPLDFERGHLDEMDDVPGKSMIRVLAGNLVCHVRDFLSFLRSVDTGLRDERRESLANIFGAQDRDGSYDF